MYMMLAQSYVEPPLQRGRLCLGLKMPVTMLLGCSQASAPLEAAEMGIPRVQVRITSVVAPDIISLQKQQRPGHVAC